MSTTIDEKALADYEALCASPNLRTGPWRVWYDDDGEGDEMGLSARWPYQLLAGADGETDGEIEILEFTGGNIPSDEEAEFIAASRTMGPLLAAKVRELKAENAKLRRELVDKVDPAEGGVKLAQWARGDR